MQALAIMLSKLRKNKEIMKKRIDYFKLSLIVFLIGFLYVFYLYSQNGRYSNYNEEMWKVIIDTRNGSLYGMTDDGLKQIQGPVKKEISKSEIDED